MNAPTPSGSRPLRGYRVLDFSANIAGPYCSRWLSDLGAEVIKIESLSGDHMRTRPPMRKGQSAFFGHVNSGKKFVSLNLKNPEIVELIKDMLPKTDVLVDAFRPGVMERLGLGPTIARQINPRLVYCSISGFGQTGALASRPAYAPVVHAASGFYMATFEYQDNAEKPPNSGIPLGDVLTASFAAMSIQSALLERERTGAGSTIDVSLMDSMMSLMTYEIQAAQFPLPNRRPLYKPMRALDGFVMVTPINARNFANLSDALEHPEWKTDPLFSTPKARYDNWTELMRRVEDWTSRRTASQCEEKLMAAGVPCSRYRSVAEAIHDEQFVHRRTFADIEDAAGPYKTSNLPFSINGEKPQSGPHVGCLGEDTRDVLMRLAGLSEQSVDALARNGAASLGTTAVQVFQGDRH